MKRGTLRHWVKVSCVGEELNGPMSANPSNACCCWSLDLFRATRPLLICVGYTSVAEKGKRW